METTRNLSELQKDLEKKSTFQNALKSLTKIAIFCNKSDIELCNQLIAIASRVFVILKTRHSNITFWRNGTDYFRSCKSFCTSASEEAKINHFLQESQEYIDEHRQREGEEEPTLENANEVDIFYQTGLERPVHFDDAGPIVDDQSRWQRAQSSGVNQEGRTDSDGTTLQTAAENVRPRHAELQRSILEGLQAVYNGMEAVARGTEAIERELESVLSILRVREGDPAHAPRAPPASKRVVSSLPRVVLDDGGSAAERVCAVCTEDLHAGDEVQILPCKHMYHVACLAPWLTTTNSCPTCRHELPTDDHRYEARREAAAEEEEAAQGAAAALSHNEFMYI